MSSASKSRTRLFRAVCTLALCAAPCLASLASSSRTSSQPLTDAAAGRSPLVMHIHMVHMREFDLREGKAVARFEFHNSSDQTLHIDKIKPSCGCVTTRLNQPLDGYESEASGEFYLEVDTSAESSGQHQYDVAIHYHMGDKKDADAPSLTEQVVFRVDVPEKKVTVRPRALIFYQFTEQPTVQPVNITDFRQGKDLEVLDVRVECPHVTSGELQRTADENGNVKWTFPITAAGAVPSGRQTGQVFIRTNDSEFGELRIPVLIYGPPEQQAAKPAAKAEK